MPVIRAAIIGSGAAGLSVAHHLTMPGRQDGSGDNDPVLFEPTIFEMGKGVGGTWRYTDETGIDTNNNKIFSSMYKHLRTNLPKEVMAFPDFPFPEHPDGASFIGHEAVLEYLENYAAHFDLKKHVKFGTVVTRVAPSKDEEKETWTVTTTNIDDRSVTESAVFDVVAVSSGHFSDPYYPEFEGKESFLGQISHSHDYRENTSYGGKTVALLGANSSGVDLAVELSKVAKKVYLCTRYPEKIKSSFPAKVEICPPIERLSQYGMCLENGRVCYVDNLIYCTGYHLAFPFLSPDVKIGITDHRLAPIYKHLVSIHHPSLAFFGIPTSICPFPIFHQQAAFMRRVWDGSIQLPTVEDMLSDEAEELRARTETLNWPVRYAHKMGSLQWSYADSLASLGNFAPLPKVRQNLYEFVFKTRHYEFQKYRDYKYDVLDDHNFTVRQ